MASVYVLKCECWAMLGLWIGDDGQKMSVDHRDAWWGKCQRKYKFHSRMVGSHSIVFINDDDALVNMFQISVQRVVVLQVFRWIACGDETKHPIEPAAKRIIAMTKKYESRVILKVNGKHKDNISMYLSWISRVVWSSINGFAILETQKNPPFMAFKGSTKPGCLKNKQSKIYKLNELQKA
eukprot:gene6633-5041_t